MPSFLLAVIVATTVQPADNIGVLGSKPRWDVLERYQQTITHDEFLHLIYDVYCTHGFAADLIDVNDDHARILISRQAQEFLHSGLLKTMLRADRCRGCGDQRNLYRQRCSRSRYQV